MHDRGDRHIDHKKEARRPKAEADQEEETTDGFGKSGHQSPEDRISRYSNELHGFTKLDPKVRTLHEFGKSMRQKGESDEDAEKEESGVAVFAE